MIEKINQAKPYMIVPSKFWYYLQCTRELSRSVAFANAKIRSPLSIKNFTIENILNISMLHALPKSKLWSVLQNRIFKCRTYMACGHWHHNIFCRHVG